MPRQKTSKPQTEEVTDVNDFGSMDGSLLPPYLSGPLASRPPSPLIDRTMYYEQDTGNVSMYIEGKWNHIENRKIA